MTLKIPDISHHQQGIDLHAVKMQGAAAIIARVGQGAGRRTNGQTYGTTQDREWVRHRDESRRVGLPLIAYWYTGNLITPEENARLAEAWVGDKAIPWMLDHEDASGDAAMYCATVAAFRARGLRVILGYVPNWYWAGAMGRKSLRCGPPIVNSRYSTANGTADQIYAAAGGDSGNGWINYGDQTTIMWQYTNKAAFAGKLIDCSAFRGSLPELLALINGSENDMQPTDLVVDPATGQPALDTNGNTYTYNQAWYYTNLSGWVLRDGVAELKAQIAAMQAAVAAIANDQDITPDQLSAVVDAAVAAHTPTAQQVAEAQADMLGDIIREVVPDEFAEQVVQKLGQKLGARPTGGTLLMPNLIGAGVAEAESALMAIGWYGGLNQVSGSTDDPSRLNKITAQDVQPGVSIAPGQTLSITVARELVTGGQ